MTRRHLATLAATAALGLVAASCGETAETDTSGSAVSAAAGVASGATEDGTSTAADATTATAAGGPIKAAWIYVGSKNDAGWTKAHDDGRLAVEEALGDQVETTFKENVPEGPQTAQVIEDLVRDGNKIIFATSFGYQDPMEAAAKAHPDVYFEQATGFKTAPNLTHYFGAGEDGIYLSGMAAGAVSENGKLGYVAPFPIPEVIRHVNAWALGAQATNPKASVQVVWTNSWFDPGKEKNAAESLIAKGADVLGQNVDSPATGQAAEAAGVRWTGYDSDASSFAPKAWVTASVYNWGPYYTRRVQAAMDGTWTNESYYGGLADGFVDLAPIADDVPAETKTKIEETRAALVDGSFYEFTGPLKDQSGKERVPEGTRMTREEILAMDWFVEGVIGNPAGGS